MRQLLRVLKAYGGIPLRGVSVTQQHPPFSRDGVTASLSLRVDVYLANAARQRREERSRFCDVAGSGGGGEVGERKAVQRVESEKEETMRLYSINIFVPKTVKCVEAELDSSTWTLALRHKQEIWTCATTRDDT